MPEYERAHPFGVLAYGLAFLPAHASQHGLAKGLNGHGLVSIQVSNLAQNHIAILSPPPQQMDIPMSRHVAAAATTTTRMPLLCIKTATY
jgi:hypothetical protein